jgi:hypothetical protein
MDNRLAAGFNVGTAYGGSGGEAERLLGSAVRERKAMLGVLSMRESS